MEPTKGKTLKLKATCEFALGGDTTTDPKGNKVAGPTRSVKKGDVFEREVGDPWAQKMVDKGLLYDPEGVMLALKEKEEKK